MNQNNLNAQLQQTLEIFAPQEMEQMEANFERALAAINFAIERGQTNKFIQLIDNEVINSKISIDDVYLIIEQAAAQKKLEIITETLKRYTLDEGNLKSYQGIIEASKAGNLEIFQFLLDYFDTKDLEDESDYARISVQEALQKAVAHDNSVMINYILDNNLIPSFGDPQKGRVRKYSSIFLTPCFFSVFQTAMDNNHLRGFKTLIDNDNILNKSNNLKSALSNSTQNSHVKMTKLLLDKVLEHFEESDTQDLCNCFSNAVIKLINTPSLKVNIDAVAICNIFLSHSLFREQKKVNYVFFSMVKWFSPEESLEQKMLTFKMALQVFSKHISLLDLLEMVKEEHGDDDTREYLKDLKIAIKERTILNDSISFVAIDKKINDTKMKNKI